MRITRWILAGWYLLASTNLPAFALEQLIPQTKTVASADFPCAHHDCGCRTAEQCRLRCCCHPTRRQPLPSHALCRLPHESRPQIVHVSYWSEAQCKGHSDRNHLLSQRLDPHLPVTATVSMVAEIPETHALSEQPPIRQAFRALPDKIPIEPA